MLTPQMIEQMNAISGKNVPLDPNAPPSRAEQILKIGQQAEAQKAAQAEAAKPKLGQGAAGEFAGNAVRTVGEGLLAPGAAMESLLDKTLGGGKTHTGEDTQKVIDDSKANHADTLAGKGGDIAGVVAPYLTGMGEEEAGAALASHIPALAEKLGMSAETFVPKLASYLAKVAPTIAKNATIGTAQTEDPEKGAAIGLGGEAIGATGKAIGALGKVASDVVSKPLEESEAKAVQGYRAKNPFFSRVADALQGKAEEPRTGKSVIFDKGLMGTASGIGTQARRAMSSTWKDTVQPALDSIPEKVDMNDFFSKVEQKVRDENPELDRQGDLLKALDALKDSYKDTKDITYNQLQDFKEGWAKNLPEKVWKGKPIAGAFNEVKNVAAAQARNMIHDAIGGDAKQAYLEYGNLKSVADWGAKEMTSNPRINGGGIINALKDNIVTPIGTIGGQVVYRIGNGLEYVGAPGAKYLSDLFTNEPH